MDSANKILIVLFNKQLTNSSAGEVCCLRTIQWQLNMNRGEGCLEKEVKAISETFAKGEVKFNQFIHCGD